MIWTRFEVVGALAVPLGLMLAQINLPLTLVAQGEAQFSYTEADVSFSEDVTPIFEGKCVSCHGGADENGAITKEIELDLTSDDALIVGSEFGSIVEPGNAEDSVLWMMIEVGDMPQDGEPLTIEELEVIKTWIAEGAQNN